MTIFHSTLPLFVVISLAYGQNFGDTSSGSIPQTFSDSGNAVQPPPLLFADSPSPIGDPRTSAFPSSSNPLQQGPTSTIRETRIITNNVIREVPRSVPLGSRVLPVSQPAIIRQPLVGQTVAAVPPPVANPTRRRSRGRRPVPSTPFAQDSQISPCDQVKESGPCFDVNIRWAYNPTSGKCHEFIYGGCNGNSNQFTTAQECMNICGTTQFQTLGLQPINSVVTVV